MFYDGLVVPGALLLLASGTWLIVSSYGGWEFLKVPWLVGMVILFAFEFIEGNTITSLYFMRLRVWREQRSQRSGSHQNLPTPVQSSLRCRALPDIPILLVIVSLFGALQPSDWT